MADLQSLIERVEKAKGPYRELDLDLLDALCDAKRHRSYWDWHASRPKGTAERPTREFWINPSRYLALTGSIDAALALVNEVMPGADYELHTARHRIGMRAAVWYPTVHAGDAPTLPLAILLALLRAMQAREEVGA